MARVNHKLVKQRLNEKRSKITDRQFFTSRLLAGHFEDMAAAQTRRYRYNRRVHVNLIWETNSDTTAFTDNQSILINCGNKFLTKVRGRENRYQIVCGFFAHELGHVLYTDFLASQTHMNMLAQGKWFPEKPVLKTKADVKNESALWDYANDCPENMTALQYVASFISNVIEDGYIEERMLINFPGTLKYGLESLRDHHFEEMPTVTQLIEDEDSGKRHLFESILQNILSYVKYGEIKYGDEPLNDVRIKTVFDIILDIDNALMSNSAKERIQITNYILVHCWEYIKDYLEECKKRHNDAISMGSTITISETLANMLGSMNGSSTTGSGDSTPVAQPSNTSSKQTTAIKRAKTKVDAGKTNSIDNSNADKNESGSKNTMPQTETENNILPSESGEEDAGSDVENGLSPIDGTLKGSGKQNVTASEGGRIPYHQTDILSEPQGGTTKYDNDYQRQKYDRAASDIERLLDKMAEKEACKELENARLKELRDVAQNIAYGDIHQGVNICVRRINSVDEGLIDQYNEISAPLLAISKQLKKSILRQFEDHRRGGKQTGLMMGRRLEVRALCRNDGKVFSKNALPNEIPHLSVGLLIDESGSMSSADRCTYARAAAIILYDFCESLDIPIMIYGHSTSRDDVELFSYAEFEGFDNGDKYRLMDIHARGSNRDGAALRFVADQLSKRSEDVKILILISDGQPAHSGYSGTAAEEDLRGIKQEYQKKGILFIAAAIGDDKNNIERIYGNSFLDITDLAQIPIKLTSVIKKHLQF